MSRDAGAAVGLLRIRLRLPSRTLKEKRTIVRSVVERVRNRYNAAAAEVADLDAVEFATIGVACLSNDPTHADAMLQEFARFIESERLDAEVIGVETELIAL